MWHFANHFEVLADIAEAVNGFSKSRPGWKKDPKKLLLWIVKVKMVLPSKVGQK